jgi:alpha-N-arabinofuranosidase
MRYFPLLLLMVLLVSPAVAQNAQNRLIIHADQGKHTISKHIYGHFSEHLGRCIYGGIWVGEDSSIPNVNGYRKDVMEALKAINIPNLRWPGGCFADEYHWEDGIGPRADRPKMINTHWGGVVEDNSFGTHEFLNYCELLGTEPYICGNVGSGTVSEMADWVEYINFNGESPMANLRRENGKHDAWGLKYWGVGNENWGCGGNMTPEYYADLYRRYATYCRNYGDNRLYKVAGGANSWDLNWTEVLMKNIPLNMMNGISLHYYTVTNTWQNKGSATEFTDQEYLTTLSKAAAMDELLNRHIAVMDRYDPRKRVELIVDEWGTWYDVEPGTNPGFLYQQNTLRDAFVAGITLNIFNNHAERVHMANLAQTVNVLQALVLTEEDKMLLTPTYHVFDLYKVHQDAVLLPSEINSVTLKEGDQEMAALHVSSSKSADGTLNISLVNIDPSRDLDLQCELRGATGLKEVKGRYLTAAALNTHNTFDKPEQVKIQDFKGVKLRKDMLEVKVPARSVVVLQLK